MTDCAKGCTHHNRHATDCLCTPECVDHPNHCRGCLPRAADVGNYCQKCADKFRDALHGIPELVMHLSLMDKLVTKATTGDRSRRATKVDQMSPSPVFDLADEVILWASSWAWVVAGRRGYDPIKYNMAGLPCHDLTTAIGHISNRLTQALTDDYHADLYDETISYHKRLTYSTGMDRVTHRLKNPCPSCDQRTLIREDGKSFVQCRNRACARVWQEDEYGTLAHVAAS